MRRARVLLLGLLAACGGDERPAVWTYISPAIVQPGCATARCHARGAAAAGLQLDTVEGGYFLLVGSAPPAPGDAPHAQSFVVPGRPRASRLVHLLRGQETRRMPPDEPLPEADIALVERWIEAGAPFQEAP